MSEKDAGQRPGDRLRAARKELGMSQTELAEAIGVTQSSVAAYESHGRLPPTPVLLALEHELRIDHEWVMSGRGEPFRSVGTPQPVVFADEDRRERVRELEGQDAYYAVPYLRDPAAAGQGLIMEEQIAGYCLVHRRVAANPDRLRCVRISGDSMAPTLTDGSIVAVDVTPVPPRNLEGRIVCSRTADGGVVIKRLRVRGHFLLLFSDNEDQRTFPPLVLDLREMDEPIIGQVIWAWVDLR